jgi:hypothetical protein
MEEMYSDQRRGRRLILIVVEERSLLTLYPLA